MIRFGILGGGWRTEFFLRAAKTLPDEMEITGVLMRSKEKGELLHARFGFPVVYNLDDLLRQKPDFVIVAYPWDVATQTNLELFERGDVAILSETPVAHNADAVHAVWRAAKAHNARIQVAEQYAFQPYHSALLKLVDEGTVGEVTDVLISMIHGYHGINVMRRYLNAGRIPVSISGRRFPGRVLETCSRGGVVHSGRIIPANRDCAVFDFANGTIGNFEFCDEQYFSQLRSRFLRINGTRGEIFNQSVLYVSDAGEYVSGALSRVDLGLFSSLEGYSLRGITFNGRYIYRNPFEEKVIADQRRLNDDEIAVATMLRAMKTYVETGEEFYGIDDACYDTYLSHQLTQVMETGRPVEIRGLPWMEE